MVTKMTPVLVEYSVIAPINLDLNNMNCVQTSRHQTIIIPCQKSNGNANISHGETVARTIRMYTRHFQERLKCVLNLVRRDMDRHIAKLSKTALMLCLIILVY